MGFTIAQSQCLVAPPYAFAAVVMYVESWLGDKYRVRGPQILFNAVVAIIGLSLMGWTTTSGVRYFGVFLFCAPVQANVVMVMSFQANNIRGQWKRAFCSASLVGFGGIGKENPTLLLHPKRKIWVWLIIKRTLTHSFFLNTGGIAGSLVFREQDQPGYVPGLWACITACLVTIIITLSLQIHFWIQNKKADRGEKELEGGGPSFRYTL